MLVICLFDKAINLCELVKLIGMIICFSKEPLVIMLIFGFSFLLSFNTLCISLIFLAERLKKIFLIFTISLILFLDTWAYKHLLWKKKGLKDDEKKVILNL